MRILFVILIFLSFINSDYIRAQTKIELPSSVALPEQILFPNQQVEPRSEMVAQEDTPVTTSEPLSTQEAVVSTVLEQPKAQESIIAPPAELPANTVELKEASHPAEVTEIEGIDTLNIDEPKGNWLLKRIWWEKAERLYEKINQLQQDVLESRMSFFQRRTEIDRTIFDPFYVKIGIGQGELQEIIGSLLATIEKMREEKGSLNTKQREFAIALELEQDTLKAIEQKLKAASAVDNGIDDAILKLMEQINRVREYEKQAWDTFKTITRELSDKRARELYYSLENSLKNIEIINGYIKNQFTAYFDQLTDKAQSITREMEAAIAALKEKGIDLKTQAVNMVKLQDSASQNTQEVQHEEQKEQENEQPQERGWFGWVFDFVEILWHGVSGAWLYVTSFFGNTMSNTRESSNIENNNEHSVEQ
jgi:tryptophan 2,3-dioxygenase